MSCDVIAVSLKLLLEELFALPKLLQPSLAVVLLARIFLVVTHGGVGRRVSTERLWCPSGKVVQPRA